MPLKLAECYVDITINKSQFEAGLAIVISRLNQLKGLGTVSLKLDRAAATANLNLFNQQLAALKRSAAGLRLGAGGGGVGGVGAPRAGAAGVGGGGGGFISGLGQGLGITSFAMGPEMMAGQLVGQGVAGAARQAMDMEAQMAELRRVAGLTEAESAKLKASIYDIAATQGGVGLQDVVDIAGAGARMGVADQGGVGSLTAFTRDLAKLRNAVDGMDTEKMAVDMGKLVGLYGEGTDKILGYGSALVGLDNVSKATAGDILAVSTGLAGTAANIKIGIPQLMAFSSVLKDAGLSNSIAIGSFSQIFRMMAKDTEGFAEHIGVPAAEFRDLMNTDVMGALVLVSKKFKEIASGDSVAAQEWIGELGFKGVRTAGALQQLASQIDNVARRTKIAQEETETKKSVEEADRIKSQTAKAAVGKFVNAAKEAADVAGEAVGATGAIKVAADVGTGALRVASGKEVPMVQVNGRVVPATQENQNAGVGGGVGWMDVVAGLFGARRINPILTGKALQDAQLLEKHRDESERIRKQAAWERSPAGLRERGLRERAAEMREDQRKQDEMLAAWRAREAQKASGLGFPGTGPLYQDMVAAQKAWEGQPDIVKWGRPGKQGKPNPFKTDQFLGPGGGVADFGVGAIRDAIAGKKTDDMTREQLERLDDIRDILRQIADTPGGRSTPGAILRGRQ